MVDLCLLHEVMWRVQGSCGKNGEAIWVVVV